MPPTPKDPREFFGFGRRQFSDYFDVPKDAAFNPAFSPAARERLMQDEVAVRGREDLRRQWESEDEANALLDEAPYMRPRQVENRLMGNPRLLATPQGQTLQEFLDSRYKRQEQQRERSKAEQSLANYFVRSLDDPLLREDFNQQIAQGVPFEQARDSVWNRQYNQKHEVGLAEAGVPATEFESLKRNGRYDPVAVAQRVQEAKTSVSRGKDELDRRIELLTDAMRTRQRVLEAKGEDLNKDILFNRYNEQLDQAIAQKLGEPTALAAPAAPPPPAPGGESPPAVQPPAAVPALPQTPNPQAFLEGLPPEEARARYQQQREAQTIQNEIARAWTGAKKSIGEKVLQVYPDRDEESGNEAVLAARAILGDARVTNPDDPETTLPYAWNVLRKAGLQPGEVLFKEPGNERWGTQTVRNTEALREWARDFLQSKGLLQTGEPTVEDFDISEEDKALLNKYLPK